MGEAGARMGEPRELEEFAGDGIGGTGLALSFERRACIGCACGVPVRTPPRHMRRDLPLPKSSTSAILVLETGISGMSLRSAVKEAGLPVQPRFSV
jgi:hypothetical protein